MPEFLSPGVFIEEVPSSLKAIEGVSTSTAAFIGPAARGTVPGYVWPGMAQPGLPFIPTGGFVMTPDPAPVLVTSFAEFQRAFGRPLPIPLPTEDDWGFLGHSVRAFFDNGGRRIYIGRIVDGATATPGTIRIAQGVVYRLARSARAGDQTVFLTSTRGLNVGDAISFRRHSDGADALSTAQSARVLGTTAVAPFAVKDGDQVLVTPSVGAPVNMQFVGKPAVLTATPPGPPNFNIADGDTLQIRVGAVTEPVQTITFRAADPLAPITAGAATPVEVAAVFTRYATGVSAFVNAGNVVLETDVRGTAAVLAVVGGTAAAALGTSIVQAAGSNVPDIGHVSVADIHALPTIAGSPDIAVVEDGGHHVGFVTKAAGAGITLTVANVPAASGALGRLGIVPPLTGTGGGAAPAPVTITGYDLQSNSITFGAGLTLALDANDVFAVVTLGAQAPQAGKGPKFFARNPGSWSDDVTVQVANADRTPVAISGVTSTATTSTLTVGSTSSFYVGGVVEVDHDGAVRSVHQVTDVKAALRQIVISPALSAPAVTAAGQVRTLEIDITISDDSGAAPTETYRSLSWNQDATFADLHRHYAWQINARSRLIWAQPPGVGLPGPLTLSGSEGATLATQPCTTAGFPIKISAAGTPGADGSAPGDGAYVGQDNGPGQRSGLAALLDLTDARLVAAPGRTSAAVQAALITQCELLRYRFAILDGEQDPAGGSITSILKHRNLYDTSFASYNAPWVTISLDGQNRQLPPSGFLAGIYARVDNARGVWKAPANEVVLDAVGLKVYFSTGEQDVLNPVGVNLIRRFDSGGIRVWGARTLSSDPDVKYINVRRTLIFLEASIDRGTQWVVFEPNGPDTWVRLTNSVSAFLLTQWRAGALFGRKPEDAFFVRCDESTMTADDILNGRLICQIGVAIVRPAEFVIFQIQQITNFGGKP